MPYGQNSNPNNVAKFLDSCMKLWRAFGYQIPTNFNHSKNWIIVSKQIPLFKNKQLKKVFDWLSGNKDWALEVFYELNPELR